MVEQDARKSRIATQCAKIFGAKFVERERWERLADGFAVALAVSLPWSVSLTGIFVAIWLIVLVPTLNIARLRQVAATPAGGLPVLFWLLALVGMLWAFGVPIAERWDGLKSLYKLLVIPLLMFQFQRSDRAPWVMNGFLLSCGVLLALSWLLILVPTLELPWERQGGFGLPVKDYIAQCGEFVVCTFLLAGIALKAWREQRRGFVVALLLCASLFMSNLYFITTSRTVLVVIPVLLLLFIVRHCDRRWTAGLLLAMAATGTAVWFVAPNISSNVTDVVREVHSFRPEGESTRAGERLEFWRKSIGFIADAPVLGHGTGSIRDQYRRAAGQSGMAAMVPANPHNQTFAVAIQLGLLGTALLFAMWLAHAALFRGDGLVAWAGLVVVIQNVVSSLFNSHLFDFTQGWGYVIGVGVAAGALLKLERERRIGT